MVAQKKSKFNIIYKTHNHKAINIKKKKESYITLRHHVNVEL